MTTYTTKPTEIQAVELTMDVLLGNVPLPEWAPPFVTFYPRSVECKTLQGNVEATEGDYLILGVNGDEVYPCNPAVFHKKYQAGALAAGEITPFTVLHTYNHLLVQLAAIKTDQRTPADRCVAIQITDVEKIRSHYIVECLYPMIGEKIQVITDPLLEKITPKGA